MLLVQFCLDNKYKKCKAFKFLILIVSNKLSLKICFGVKLFENLIVTHFYNFKKLVGIEALKVKISLITWDSVHPLVYGILWLCVWLTGVVVVAEVHAKTWLPWLLLPLEWWPRLTTTPLSWRIPMCGALRKQLTTQPSASRGNTNSLTLLVLASHLAN